MGAPVLLDGGGDVECKGGGVVELGLVWVRVGMRVGVGVGLGGRS